MSRRYQKKRKQPPAKPCGCRFGSCLKCLAPEKQTLREQRNNAMLVDYTAGMSLNGLAKKYGIHRQSIRECFHRRGWPLRAPRQMPNLDPITGCFIPVQRKSAAEITAIIAGMKRLCVPETIKQEWRHWTMAERGAFIQRVRKELNLPARPAGKFSSNVVPFDYTTPAAHEIQRRENEGRGSHQFRAKIKVSSEGVIFEGQLYFFVGNDQAYRRGPFIPGKGRTALHHLLYERHHGAIPAQHTVIHRDGNKNNLDPQNLTLRSMADCAKMNHWKHKPAAEQKKLITGIAEKAWQTKHRKNLLRQRGLVTAMLNPKPETGLLATLQRRK